MNIDNKNKAIKGSASKSSLKTSLEYLKEKGYITEFSSMKFGYPGKRQTQFKCDYKLNLSNGDEWILFSPSSLTSDRLKTKQWDAFHIKAINPNVKKAYIVCPDSSNSQNSIYTYREYIRKGEDVSAVDDILFTTEFTNLIENLGLGTTLAGRKAAKKGFNFESLLVRILNDKQNFSRWKGNKLAVGFQYPIFKKIMDKLGLDPSTVKSVSGDSNIPKLPNYTYKDGSQKKGGKPKTDVCLTVQFEDETCKDFTFSCKSSSKYSITVAQFPPKYCVELLGIKESDTEQLLNEYVKSGGPNNMDASQAELLTKRLSSYIDQFNLWVLHGSENDGSIPKQRADYLITRIQKSGKEEIIVETIDECIQAQIKLGKGHFGTAYSWTVTSSKKKKDGTKTEVFPVMRIIVSTAIGG